MHRFVVIGILAFFPITLAVAEDSVQSSEVSQDTRIEADDKLGVIRFYVKDELSAVLKEDGLHVQKNIFYGGSITDVGATPLNTKQDEDTTATEATDAP